MIYLTVLAPVASVLSLILAYGLSAWTKKVDEGEGKMKEAAGVIRKGAIAFLNRAYMAMIAVIIAFFGLIGYFIGWRISVLFLCGALLSAVAVFLGMCSAVDGNARTANAALTNSMDKPLRTALRSGSVMGLCLTGLGLLGIGCTVLVLGAAQAATVLTGFVLGASLIALFGRVGGGIYSKKALGAGKIHVAGGYVEDVAGTGSDLFESYAGALVSAVMISAFMPMIYPRFGESFALDPITGTALPLALLAFGAFGSMAGIMLVRGGESANTVASLNTGIYVNGIFVIVSALFLSKTLFGTFNCAAAIIAGLIAGIAISKTTAAGSRELRANMLSAAGAMVFIALGIFTADALAGLYGITLAAVGMLSISAMKAAACAFGYVSDNAAEIAEIAELPEEARQITEKLKATGVTISSAGKGFVTGSAAFTSIALFAVYARSVRLGSIDMLDPLVITGLLTGAMLPFLFSAFTMKFDQTAEDGSAKAALSETAAPGLIAITAPLAVGIVLGTEALGGMLAGAIASGVLISILMTNGGGFFKDACGPSINILIKLMMIVSVTSASVFIKIGGLI